MPKKIKILHIIQVMRSGGVEQRKLLLAQNLPRNTFEQKIICTTADPVFKTKFEKEECEVFEIGPFLHPLDLGTHLKVLRIIRKFKPEIIHGSVFEGVTLAAINGFLMRVPIRIIEETSYPTLRKPRANKLLRLFAYLSHQVIAISPEVKNYLTETAIIPKHKIKLIPNGVKDPIKLNDLDKKSLRKKLNIHEEDIVIGTVGRMENNVKGFDKLIPLFAYLKKEIPNLKLLIIGDGKLLGEYKTLAEHYKISESVLFLGYQNEVNDFYEIMDFYITLPRSEGFGLSIVEAMSHSIPVFATNIGGIRNIIRHGLNGFFLEGDKSEVLKQILLELTHNKTLNKYIKDQAYITYKENFNSKKYASSIESLYQESLK